MQARVIPEFFQYGEREAQKRDDIGLMERASPKSPGNTPSNTTATRSISEHAAQAKESRTIIQGNTIPGVERAKTIILKTI